MDRRNFLKTLFGILIASAGLYLLRAFSVFTRSHRHNSSALKDAAFYRASDDLAG